MSEQHGLLLAALVLVAVSGALLVSLLRVRSALGALRKRFAPVLDGEAERQRFANEADALRSQNAERRADWERQFREAMNELASLTQQLDAARDAVQLQSFGLYEPHYDFATSAEYKERLDRVHGEQKKMIRDKGAAVCPTEWRIEGNLAEGRKMVRRQLKLMLRAFNGECDAAVAKVRYDNVVAIEERIARAFEAINKLGEPPLLPHIRVLTTSTGRASTCL